jgi:chromosome segregation and condensation protein ScpB
MLDVSIAVVRRLHADTNHDVMTLGFVQKLADVLAIDMMDLFVRYPGAASMGEGDAGRCDAVALEAALAETQRPMATEELAEGLGWRLHRVRAAATELRARLDGTGLVLHHNRNGYSLRVRGGVLTHEEQRGLHARRSARDGLRHSDNRVLHQIAQAGTTGKAYKNAGASTHVSIDLLCKLGLVERGGAGGYKLTDDGRESLLVDEFDN